MTHKNPDQLIRLIKSLHHPQADFYIHIDRKVPIEIFKAAGCISQVHFIKNRVKCNWGGNSFFHCIISTLKEVLSLGKKYDFFNLLSGQDYPLKSAEFIHDYFERRKGMNFISYEQSHESEWWKGAILRYEKYHFTDSDFRLKYLVQHVTNLVMPKRKFPIPVELYGGSKSSWWTISMECADYVVETSSKNLKLNNFLKYSWGTDEFVITTLIMNSPFKEKTINENLRYIDWSEGNANPKLLDITDFEFLSKSKMLFARKFDPDYDSEVLERIDSELLGLDFQ